MTTKYDIYAAGSTRRIGKLTFDDENGIAGLLLEEQSLADYIAIGANPAQSGAIRLTNGEAIASSSQTADEDSGWEGGNQNLIALITKDDIAHGNGQWSVIRIGDRTGPLGREMVYDPYWNGSFTLTDATALVVVPGAYNSEGYLPVGYAGLDLTGLAMSGGYALSVLYQGVCRPHCAKWAMSESEVVVVSLPRNIAHAFQQWLERTPMPTPALKREAADAQEALESALKEVSE